MFEKKRTAFGLIFKRTLVGLAMGVADLVPGVSGGTIAFISGIYVELLQGIRSLQLHQPSKIAWSILLPIGGGILFSLFLLSKFLYFLMIHYPAALYAFFFGVVLASTCFSWRKVKPVRLPHYFCLILGAILSLLLGFLPLSMLFGIGFFGLMIAGVLAGCVMLLPGISGSYMLHLLGVYPLMVSSFSNPTAPSSLKNLISMGLGLSLGVIIISRVIASLLNHFRQSTLAVLIGFMVGGLRSLWSSSHWGYALIGFILIVLIEFIVKKVSSSDPSTDPKSSSQLKS